MHRLLFRIASIAFFGTLSLPTISLAQSRSGGPLGWGNSRLEQAMGTDRPDFTEGTQSVQSGHFQFEMGYTFVSDRQSGTRTNDHSLPEVLARLGLTEELELRLSWEGYRHTKLDSSHSEGISEAGIGFKYELSAQDKLMPSISILPDLSLPLGTNEFRSNVLSPSLGLLWAYELELFSLAGNVNSTYSKDLEGRYYELSSSVSLGAKISETVGFYTEYFVLIPTEENTETIEHYANCGLTFLATETLQLDVRAGGGLNGKADDFFTGIGITFLR